MSKITSDYFRSQVLELRERWGKRSFWTDQETAHAALKAIAYIYLRVDELRDGDQIIFESTVIELLRRKELIDRVGLPV